VPQHSLSRRRRLSVGTGTAALSLGLCLCAGQLLSTAPALAAPTTTAPVVQAVAVAKVTPAVRTSISSRTLNSGATMRVTVRYTNPKTGKPVTTGTAHLMYWDGARWRGWSKANLNNNGSANLYAAPKASHYFRVVYGGSSTASAVRGGKFYVTVRSNGAKVLAEAKSHTGALYKFAAAGPKRFDCSGFTKYVYKKAAGKNLPHKANLQQRYGKAVSKGAKQIGDLIVFRSGSYGYHAGIYAGNGYMYDSPHTGARVGKHKMYGSNYVVRRLV
jgi:cell wall-associated NlpC family hydrolase